MDKYEYKLRSEEIRTLIKKREFAKAVEIADTIDWSRVRSVSTLCTISDLYKINRRFKESKDLLLQAYERYPGGRMIVYSLCELCIKMDEVVQAIEYYKEFVQLAPTDNGKFILQYKIYEAQNVSLEERIAVLEELKKRDYREKWGYELAYLYHRIGLATNCVEECDQLILWFHDGVYVKKAMELKMLHQPLGAQQEEAYQEMLTPKEKREHVSQQTTVYSKVSQFSNQENTEEPDIQVKTMDVGKYNTINLQKELAESMKQVLVADNGFKPLVEEQTQTETLIPEEDDSVLEEEDETLDDEDSKPGAVTQAIMAPMLQDTADMEELFSDDRERAAQRIVEAAKEPIEDMIDRKVKEAVKEVVEERPSVREIVTSALIPDNVKDGQIVEPVETDLSKIEPPEQMGQLLSQEYDGQISLVVPENEQVEKQITGQMNLQEILAEWEKTKEQNAEKRKEEVKRHVMEQTGNLFTDFDAKVRDGILEKLEKENGLDASKIDADAEYKKYIKKIEEENENQGDAEESMMEELPEVEELEEIEEPTDEMESSGEMQPQDAESQEILSEPAEVAQPEVAGKAGEQQEETEQPETEKEETTEPSKTEEEVTTEPSKTEEVAIEPSKEEKKPEPTEVQKEASVESEKESSQTETTEEAPQQKVRPMTEDEVSLFSPFIHTRTARIQFMRELEAVSLASYTGNIFVTGEMSEEAAQLAKNILRDIQLTDHNFSGKIAKVSGDALNKKDVAQILSKLTNGGLIVEKAGEMDEKTVKTLLKELNQEANGVIVILVDSKKCMQHMMQENELLPAIFNVHMEPEELNDEALVAYGKKYAQYQEYAIDELGVLALHTRIDELQTSDHIVSVEDVRDIIDEAIAHADKKSLKHFADVLFAKRYDEDDMIILRENDFFN